MGICVFETFIFYSKEKAKLEKLYSSLKDKTKMSQNKGFGLELTWTLPNKKHFSCWKMTFSEINPANNPEIGWNFVINAETRSHSNYDAAKALCKDYSIDFCYKGGSAEAGGFDIYDPQGLYWKRNFDDYRFDDAELYLLFERVETKIIADAKTIEKLKEVSPYYFKKESIADYAKNISLFFADHQLPHKIYKINENAFYVHIKQTKWEENFINPTLEDVKMIFSNLWSDLQEQYLNENDFKTSLFFNINKGCNYFMGLTPGSRQWTDARVSFIYEGEYINLTNDKNRLFFNIDNDFANFIDFSLSTNTGEFIVEEIKNEEENKTIKGERSLLEEIKEINRDKTELICEFTNQKNS